MHKKVETINCPYCGKFKSVNWVRENGYTAVKCCKCGLVYVNPRPNQSLINQKVKTGINKNDEYRSNAISRRVGSKVNRYKKILGSMFNDVWQNSLKISWLDIGAGYGEVVEAITELASQGSRIEGIEPMKPKAIKAQERGLKVSEKYLCDVKEKFDFVSLINVFSHIPDFRKFLVETKKVLEPSGELFLETGNLSDLNDYKELPNDLDLPDHLVFAGEQHILGYLSEAGFTIGMIRRERIDGFINLSKNVIKKIIGRRVKLKIPYTSKYRQIRIRAKLIS